MNETLRDKLNAGRVMLGLGHMYPAAGIIEGMGTGWDFSWIDMQHGQHDFASTLGSIRAAEVTGLYTVVRVPGHGPDAMSKVADMDPDAVMVPMIDTVDDARAVVDALRFPPLGRRSYGGRRVIDRHGRGYCKDRDLLVVAQIETLEALDRVDEIAAVEGIDVLFFGPDDMKLRMGLDLSTSVMDNTQLSEAMHGVATAAIRAGKHSGVVAVTPDMLHTNIEMGYRLIVGGGDIMFLRNGAAAALQGLRLAIDSSQPSSPEPAPSLYGR